MKTKLYVAVSIIIGTNKNGDQTVNKNVRVYNDRERAWRSNEKRAQHFFTEDGCSKGLLVDWTDDESFVYEAEMDTVDMLEYVPTFEVTIQRTVREIRKIIVESVQTESEAMSIALEMAEHDPNYCSRAGWRHMETTTVANDASEL